VENLLGHRLADAWVIFHREVAAARVTPESCHLMLMACLTSEDMRRMIDVTMKNARQEPTVDTFNVLLSRLMVEGRRDAARRLLRETMVVARVAPDERTWATLNLGEGDLRTMRTMRFKKLLELLELGALGQPNDRAAARGAALVMFGLLVPDAVSAKRRKARFAVLVEACHESDQLNPLRSFLLDCKDDLGLTPATFTTYAALILGSQLELASSITWRTRASIAWDDKKALSHQLVVQPLSAVSKAEWGGDGESSTSTSMSFDASSLAATTAAAAAATTADNTFDYMDIARRLVRADTLPADGTLPAALLPDLPAVDLEPSIRHIDKLLKLLKQYERGKSTTADAAWAFVDKLAESKEINVIHYNLMLKACESSDEIRDLIDVQMRRAGVRPTIFTFTTLVHRLVVEGDIAAARSVAEVVMPAAGVDPSKRIWKTIELSSEFMRTTKFEQLPDMTWKALYLPADEGGEENGASTMSGVPDDLLNELILDNAYQEAWALFYDSIVTEQVNVKDCNTMLKACYDSTQMRHLIEVTMKKAGVLPNVITYNTLLGRLIVEGRREEAHEAVEEFLSTEETYAPVVDLFSGSSGGGGNNDGGNNDGGVVLAEEKVPLPGRLLPNDRTKEVLALSGRALSRFRTSLLQQLLGQGRNGATYAAWVLFDKLVRCGEVDVYQFNVMLKACEDSQQLRQIINVTMRDARVRPTMVSYTTLMNQLMMEGRETEALLVAREEMPAEDLVPDERVWKLLNSTAADLHRMRAAANMGKGDQRPDVSDRLRRLVSIQKLGKARDMFAERLRDGDAHIKECNVMMEATCYSSAQMRTFIRETMARDANVKPNVETYLILVGMLKVEGDADAARRVVEEDMVAAKVVADQRVWELIYTPESGFGEMGRRKLLRMLWSGDEHAVNAAGRLFDMLLENGLADAQLVGLMLKEACYSSDQMRRLLAVAKDIGGIAPNTIMLTTLVTRLMMEGDKAAALRVVAEEMGAAGVEVNDLTIAALKLSASRLDKMRSVKLGGWIDKGFEMSLAAAWGMLGKLVENGQANVSHFTIMIRACPDAETLQRLVYKDMARSAVTPNMTTLESLVKHLVLHGECARARAVLETGLPELGFVPTKKQRRREEFRRWEEEMVLLMGEGVAGVRGAGRKD
jgi:hypothetical protein